MSVAMDPELALAVAVDAANSACRKRGGKPSNLGCWPAEEWMIYKKTPVRAYSCFSPQIAEAIAKQHGVRISGK